MRKRKHAQMQAAIGCPFEPGLGHYQTPLWWPQFVSERTGDQLIQNSLLGTRRVCNLGAERVGEVDIAGQNKQISRARGEERYQFAPGSHEGWPVFKTHVPGNCLLAGGEETRQMKQQAR